MIAILASFLEQKKWRADSMTFIFAQRQNQTSQGMGQTAQATFLFPPF
jgi:hypothetical protein